LTRSAGAAALAALAGIVVGAATFSGSLVAAGKLANRIRQTPVTLYGHNLLLTGMAVAAALVVVLAVVTRGTTSVGWLAASLVLIAAGLGIVFSIRIGGADMPVLISFLNAGSGLAAALCGLAIGNWLLIACGAMVGVSGTILTHVMCRAMNRSLPAIFRGIRSPVAVEGPPSVAESAPGTQQAITQAAPQPLSEAIDSVAEPGPPASATPMSEDVADPFARAMAAIQSAGRVIIIPGYGMALADAQEEVVKLADKLVGMNKGVLFAIHPVAGRMPGHMHVLLAEAEVDYSQIRELKDVNAEFAQTDLAVIVGACDVVNPAAIDAPNTPISGMPILRADEARQIIVCNLDDRPGYSGVENPLYRDRRTIMLLGDAKQTVSRMLDAL
jgi:H+-translocating NAD(P) transhydrogenase subunit beta